MTQLRESQLTKIDWALIYYVVSSTPDGVKEKVPALEKLIASGPDMMCCRARGN